MGASSSKSIDITGNIEVVVILDDLTLFSNIAVFVHGFTLAVSLDNTLYIAVTENVLVLAFLEIAVTACINEKHIGFTAVFLKNKNAGRYAVP